MRRPASSGWPRGQDATVTVIRVSELGSQDGGRAFRVKVSFGDEAEYPVTVTDPGDEAIEKSLAWYFEEHLRYPFLDKDLEQQAVSQIGDYGTALHRLHWEALRDPELPGPLAVRLPVTRRVSDQSSKFVVRDDLPTVNILVVIARPDGPRDVGYRTISRPLLDALRSAGLPVTVDLVRPGTWQALSDHLQSLTRRHGSGWFHIAHFDVHGAFAEYGPLDVERQAGRLLFTPGSLAEFEGQRGFLFFETAEAGTAEPVPAEAVASLLAEHRVPVAVLNACQSAMQSGNEAGLAQRLAEAGVPVAVGMAYSVTVSAAERAMPVVYRKVADGEDLTAAITAARRDLHQHPRRQAYFGQDLELQDWMLPVMFGQRPLQVRLRAMTDYEQQEFYERQAVVAEEPETEYGFVGRDLDIQAIEHRLLAGPDSNQRRHRD